MLTNLDLTVRKTLQDTFELVRKVVPRMYTSYIKDYPLQIIIGYFENHVPKIIVIGFKIVDPNVSKIVIDTAMRGQLVIGANKAIWNEFNSP